MLKFGLGGGFAGREDAVRMAQDYFFEAIRRLYPAPLINLRDKVFPLYDRWAEQVPLVSGLENRVLYTYLLMEQEALELLNALTEWSREFRLTGEFTLDPSSPEARLWEKELPQLVRARSRWPIQAALNILCTWKRRAPR